MNTNINTLNTLPTLAAAQSQQQDGRLAQSQSAESIDKVAAEFSAVLITQLLNIMHEGIDIDPNFGGGSAEKTWRSVMLDEYGKSIGSNGGLGITDMVRAQLLQYQEV